MSDSRWIILNGDFVRAEENHLSAESRAVWYGDGCFETFRSYQGSFLKPGAHLSRLHKGLHYLEIDDPLHNRSEKTLGLIRELLQQNGQMREDTIVRIQVWRKGNRGYDVHSQREGEYSISVMPIPDFKNSYSLSTIEVRRIPERAVSCRYKISNGINYIRATTEAKKKNADDALMQTMDGTVSETPIANIFWYIDNVIYTPDENCDILPGITRALIIDLIGSKMTCQLMSGRYSLTHIKNAEACWLCNSIREIVPVSQLDDTQFNIDHPVIHEIKTAFQNVKKEYLK